MITFEHCVIRRAEYDDAPYFQRLGEPGKPRAFLLDRKREVICPTADEVREMLGRKDAHSDAFFAVEDTDGEVRGFCALRGSTKEMLFAEIVVAFLAEADYASPLADEALEFLFNRGYGGQHLIKLMTHAIDGAETAMRDMYLRHGFESGGVQRDILYTNGRWHGIEALLRFRPDWKSELMRPAEHKEERTAAPGARAAIASPPRD